MLEAVGKTGPSWGLVVVAAGTARRMGGTDKLLLDLGGHTVLWHALHAFYRTGRFSDVVLVTSEVRWDWICAECSGWSWRLHRAEGGARRQDSVLAGLRVMGALSGTPEFVAIHDGARPCLEGSLVLRVMDTVERDGAAVAALPVADTLRMGDGEDWAGATADRRGLWRMQTPQAFRWPLIWDAYDRLASQGEEFTDDVAIAQRAGHRVRLVCGSNFNFKITMPEDVIFARQLLAGSGAGSG